MRGPDEERLASWAGALRRDGLARRERAMGPAVVRVGELAAGTPYVAGTLDAYLADGGSARGPEPLIASLTRFDCVTLVESCLAVARTSLAEPSWVRFLASLTAMRYRGGVREGYASRLHYFSEWIGDGVKRGLVRDLGPELGAIEDSRPLRFMTEHRQSYPALAEEETYRAIGAMEQGLDGTPRHLIPTSQVAAIVNQLETGDVLAFATSIPGLDVTHAAMAYRDGEGVMRVLHAPLSGGVVEIASRTLPDYVAAIRRATGMLVARPLWG